MNLLNRIEIALEGFRSVGRKDNEQRYGQTADLREFLIAELIVAGQIYLHRDHVSLAEKSNNRGVSEDTLLQCFAVEAPFGRELQDDDFPIGEGLLESLRRIVIPIDRTLVGQPNAACHGGKHHQDSKASE